MADDVVHQPSHPAPDPNDAHGSVYDGLLGGDPSHWAFGTDFEDPLAGVDTTIPDGVDASDLGTYCLMLADDALIASQRLSEWTSRAPDLEDDIALSNIALDLLGQARLLLARAAAADPTLVPALPEGSPVPPEDALAFFRGDRRVPQRAARRARQRRLRGDHRQAAALLERPHRRSSSSSSTAVTTCCRPWRPRASRS